MKDTLRPLLATLAAGLLLAACAPTAQRPAAAPTAPPAAPTSAPKPAGATPAAAVPTAATIPTQILAPAAQPAQGAPQKGGTLVVAIRESVLSLDPANHRSRVTETVLRSMFEGLVNRTPDGTIVPEIAESWKQVAPDTYEFAIRQGILFHNGDPLTAEDVRFSLERVAMEGKMDGKTSPRQSLLPAISEITAPNPTTVRIKLKDAVPDAILLAGLVHNQIVPRKYVEQVGGAGLAEKPVGSGPFKFVEGKLDQQVVVERFDKYWGGSPNMAPVGPALVDRIVWRVSPELSTALAALRTGEVQIVQGVPVTSLRELRSDPSIQVKSYDGTRTTWFALNVKQPPLDKVEVRRALNYAVNVQAIVDRVLEGQAVRMAGAVPAFSQFYDRSIQPYGYDPARARQLLQQAGVGSGMQLTIDTIASFKDVAEVAAQQLREVGVEANVRVWEAAALREAALKGERQVVLWDWGNAYRHPVDLLDAVLKSGGRGNYAGYANPEVDQLLEQGATATDPQLAAAAYARAQRLIWEDAPWIFGWVPNELEAGRKEVQDWTPGPDGRELLADTWLLKR